MTLPPSDDFRATLQAAILNEAPEGILVVDQAGYIASVNARFFSLWHLPEPAAGAMSLVGTLDAVLLEQARAQSADPEGFFQQVQRLYQNPEQDDRRTIQLKDGRTLERHSTVLRGAQGQYLGRVWYFRDISELVNSRLALEISESRYRTAFETTLDAIAITTLREGLYIDVNQAFLDISAYAREDLIGRSSLEVSIWFDPADRARIAETIRCEGKVLNFETRFRKKNGAVFWGIFSASLMALDDVPCLLSITRDITEARNAREEIERHRHHLEALVAERTEDLHKAKEAAEAASIAKTAFLANMSHEIRTPLNAITGMATLIRREGLSEKQNIQLEKLEAASEHLLHIINAVLELSKIEAGKLQISRQPFSLRELMRNVVGMVQTQAQEKGLRLLIQIPPSLPDALIGDPTMLRQALLNYAVNAVKFTTRGEVRIRIEREEDGGLDCLLRFSVSDTGIGIEPQILPRLFDAFEQADNTLTRTHGGTGLGLAITRKLAELMGGSAGASSFPGRGSTFWLSARFALSEPGSLPRTSQTDTGKASGPRPSARILLAEDEPVNREIAELLLNDAGHRVECVENGELALARLQSGEFDLIVMDMQMPVMDGLEATRRIRKQLGRRLPIIALTANAFNEDRERCLSAGMNDFVTKPVSAERLLACIDHWLQVASREHDNR